jgi:hypothetical protein
MGKEVGNIMTVGVKWRYIRVDDDPAWDWSRVLYSYLDPAGKEILYIGKAVGTTVRGRWNRSAKENFWDDLEEERGIYRTRKEPTGSAVLISCCRQRHGFYCFVF